MSNDEQNNANEGQSSLTVGLAACPCGVVPTLLYIADTNHGGKWAEVYGNCCNEWKIEFRTEYNDIGSEKCMELAKEAWNDAHRSANVELTGAGTASG